MVGEHLHRVEQIVLPILNEIASSDRDSREAVNRSASLDQVTEIRLGQVGRIEGGEDSGRYVEVLDDQEVSVGSSS